MTYKEIFKEIYWENKRFIRAYLAFSLVFSIFVFGTGSVAFANDISNIDEMIATIGGSGGVVIASLVTQFLSGVEPSTTLFIVDAISVIFDLIPADKLSAFGNGVGIQGLENYSFGLLEYSVFRVAILCWFILARLSRSNRITYTSGLIFENYEGILGRIIMTIVSSIQTLANLPLGTTVHASTTSNQFSATEAAKHSFNALLFFLFLILLLVIFSLVRLLFYFMDIVLHAFSISIPFTGLGLECLKMLWVIALLYHAFAHPVFFWFMVIAILTVAIILFKKAYIAVRYFKNIYVKPFFKRFFGFDSDIPLVSPKIPRKVKRYVNEDNADIIIPVYLIKKIHANKHTHKHDRWWFVSNIEKQYICKPCFIKNTCHCIDLVNSEEKKIFIKKSLRFFEIFNLKGNEENIGRTFRFIHKKVHFVFSKEYYYRFDKIKELTKYTDYTEYSQQIRKDIKLSRREKRELKRQQKREAKEERLIARHQRKFYHNTHKET